MAPIALFLRCFRAGPRSDAQLYGIEFAFFATGFCMRNRSLPNRFPAVVFIVVSLALALVGCGSKPDDEPRLVAGAAGSSASSAGAGSGGSGGSANQGGSAGEIMPSGGAGAGVGNGGAGGVGGSGNEAAASIGGSGAGGASAAGGGAGVAAGFGGSTGGNSGSGGTAGVAAGGDSSAGGAAPQVNPLAHLVPSAREVGLLLANRFSRQPLAFDSVQSLPGDGYKTACEWYGALGVAKHTDSQELLDALVTKFDPLEDDFVSGMLAGDAHVDRYIFGIVPIEIYLQTDVPNYRSLGTEFADRQQTTNQTRDAIDDMFMMTVLQLQAYRATLDDSYLAFMSATMVEYLGAQRDNGLFFHNVSQAPVHWGRGNGWFAAGMAEMLRDLPATSGDYAIILAGYERMMEGLLAYQAPSGLWYQVLDMPDDPSNWQETSGSAMFTYAMIAGVRRGILDANIYVPAIEAAWTGLADKLSVQGDVTDICIGTWYKPTAREYMELTRLTGDGHGQAPILWAAAELLR